MITIISHRGGLPDFIGLFKSWYISAEALQHVDVKCLYLFKKKKCNQGYLMEVLGWLGFNPFDKKFGPWTDTIANIGGECEPLPF